MIKEVSQTAVEALFHTSGKETINPEALDNLDVRAELGYHYPRSNLNIRKIILQPKFFFNLRTDFSKSTHIFILIVCTV